MTLMEVKKTQPVVAAESTLQEKKVARDFISDIKTEIKKITWTDQEELVAYAKIVVGATFFSGMAIYAIDLIIQVTLGTLSYLVRLLGA